MGGAIRENYILADVICQHKRDGKIIPLKIRLVDEDGEFQTYQIRAYKELSSDGSYMMPNGVMATNHIWLFECKIVVFNTEKRIKLFYNAYDSKWKVTYVR